MRNYARAKALVEASDTSEESLSKYGLDKGLIDLVMENIERQGNK